MRHQCQVWPHGRQQLEAVVPLHQNIASCISSLVTSMAATSPELTSVPPWPAVWWHAPFFSGGGYSSEAVGFVTALHRAHALPEGQLWATQHGDSFEEQGIAALAEGDLQILVQLTRAARGLHQGRLVVVCHSEPGEVLLWPCGLSEPCPEQSCWRTNLDVKGSSRQACTQLMSWFIL